jgi:peptidoglycan/LPS O-acetylase OafA/YrhL
MRGIAALLVFFHHLCYATVSPEGWPPVIRAARFLAGYGVVGVDIFFALSGFLITSLLIRDRHSPAYYRDFYWKRGLRILPLYILCMIGVLLFIPHTAAYVLLSALFLSNFASVLHIGSNGPFWSLAIEEQFYLLWPTVVRRRSVHRVQRWAIAIVVIVCLLRFVAACLGHHNYMLSFLRFDGLALGALIACRYSHQQRKATPLSRDNPLFLFALFGGAILFVFAANFPHIGRDGAFSSALMQTGTTLFCAAIIALLVANANAPALAPLRSAGLTFFGLISYALYMIHPYILMAYDHLRGPLVPSDTYGYTLRLIVVLAVTIVASLFVRHLIELPAASLRKRVLHHSTEPAIAEQPLTALVPEN